MRSSPRSPTSPPGAEAIGDSAVETGNAYYFEEDGRLSVMDRMRGTMADSAAADRVRSFLVATVTQRYEHQASEGALAGQRELHRDDLAVLLRERDDAVALAAECSCSTAPMNYEGPEADCPVHGAVRAVIELIRELGRLRSGLRDALGVGDSSVPDADLIAIVRHYKQGMEG